MEFRDLFFDNHPDPMWIYDRQTLRFLNVNNAAVASYGYSRDEFLHMTIKDIRPDQDVADLLANVERIADGLDEAGIWRHKLKSGTTIHVAITSHTLTYDGRPSELVVARDVTTFVDTEKQKASLLAQEQRVRQEAQAAASHFQSLFQAVPGRFLVLTPDEFRIVAASDAFLDTMGIRRDAIKEGLLFDVFPPPDDRNLDGVRRLQRSLERVRSEGVVDIMGVVRYPVRQQGEERFEERFWSVVNAPVQGADGTVLFIIHRTEDVTQLVQAADIDAAAKAGLKEVNEGAAGIALDVLLRSRELQATQERLLEHEANLHAAQRLLGIGIWKMNLESRTLSWSDSIYKMYGVDRYHFGHSFDDYMALLHPDDREETIRGLNDFLGSTADYFEFAHRVVRPDGEILHVSGVGEFAGKPDNKVITGAVQDVTRQRAADTELAEANSLLRLAGKIARLGGWRADLQERTVTWTTETAAIHEAADTRVLPIERGIDFYAHEYHGRINEVFSKCAETGIPYNEIAQIVTAKGNRVWVRTNGEAERDQDGNIVAVRGAFQDISELFEERRRAEGLSRRLRETLEHISDAFLTIDHDWRFTFLNSQAEILLARSAHDLIGKNVWTEFAPAMQTNFESQYRKAFEQKETVRFVEYYPPLEKWFEVSAYPTPEGLAIYFRDVTTQRARDEQLRLLETAVSRQNDMLLITEADAVDAPGGPKIVYVNESFVRRTGFSAEEAIGQTPRILQGPKTQRDVLDRIKAAVKMKRSMRCEVINYTKAGEEVWLELDIVPITDSHGQHTHWVSIQRDITERKRAEEKSKIDEERFRLVTKAINDVIWDWDFTTGQLWWSEAFQTVFGYAPEVLEKGQESWTSRIHSEDKDRVLAGVQTAIEGTAANWMDEYRFLHAKGKALTVIDRGFIIRDERGVALRMLGSIVDVTEQREAAERLRQSQKLEAVGQLTGGVAHDFNNLLTVILGNAEMLREQLTDQQQLRLMADMTATAAERGSELTSRLLAFARRQALEPKVVNINRLVAGMDGLLRRTLNAEIDIEVAGAAGLWAAEIDPGQLEVAILNLAINARDAMPDGGRLTIETGNAMLDEAYATGHEEVEAGQYAMISISDTGHGMPSEVVDRAFEPFFTTKEVGKGSGLGLPMVYGFVKQSKGHAKIYSEDGEGTTVKLYFPRAPTDGNAADMAIVPNDHVGGTENILVVEDDMLVQQHLVAQLKSLGYGVVSANSGPNAIEILHQNTNIDLLFTDVVMPGGMNGRQLADEAKKLRPDLRVLFTSGYTENAIVHHGRLDRGVHLLSKPYRRQELATKVRKVLDE